ncbi:MAG: deoxyribose-phosphate aldolase [Planctomycetes bacterium]|nr:deoxyribose-phosphate aldolase [Planctomycetota bacterium]
MKPSREELIKMIDHTQIKPDVGRDQIIKLCNEAKQYGFCTAVIPPMYVSLCVENLKDSPVRVGSIAGFPLGYNRTEVKIVETALAFSEGAEEIDMVMNVSALKSGDYSLVRRDIEGVVLAAHGGVVKVIIEACFLTDEEKIEACKIIADAGADFVKTTTGFAHGGATVEDVRLLRKHSPKNVQVKASAGIRDAKTALAMIEAGATRIGTSTGPAIVDSYEI